MRGVASTAQTRLQALVQGDRGSTLGENKAWQLLVCSSATTAPRTDRRASCFPAQQTFRFFSSSACRSSSSCASSLASSLALSSFSLASTRTCSSGLCRAAAYRSATAAWMRASASSSSCIAVCLAVDRAGHQCCGNRSMQQHPHTTW